MSATDASARTASAQKGPRQLANCPANAPSGTPTTLASIPPAPTSPSARALAAGPAARVATTDATDQNAPVAQAVTNRAPSSRGKLEPSATTRCPTANTARASTSVTRRGTRRVSSAIEGAPTIIPTANTVISSPARATLTRRSPAISGSSPATTNSVAIIRNVPNASTYTTTGRRGGGRPRSPPRAAPPWAASPGAMLPGPARASPRMLIVILRRGSGCRLHGTSRLGCGEGRTYGGYKLNLPARRPAPTVDGGGQPGRQPHRHPRLPRQPARQAHPGAGGAARRGPTPGSRTTPRGGRRPRRREQRVVRAAGEGPH